MLLARIQDRIWPMQVSANASRRPTLSSLSVYRTTSRTALERFQLASVDSAASDSRSDRVWARIWFALAACLVELVGEAVGPGGCFPINEK